LPGADSAALSPPDSLQLHHRPIRRYVVSDDLAEARRLLAEAGLVEQALEGGGDAGGLADGFSRRPAPRAKTRAALSSWSQPIGRQRSGTPVVSAPPHEFAN
jgi:hypothetical protein